MSQETMNQFSDGLIMDLNPLTTPNNVLTNCLNGTFITFNGNEFVLQNDMGNGRVETAYLPSGYVPVGIKEYGGIIYVASYNPITNRSQIGSFPSPERNISSEELSTLNTSISNTSFFSDQELSKTVFQLKLSDNVIRSGDKFSIFLDSTESANNFIKFISQWNNINPTPKEGEIIEQSTTKRYRHNKLITLQLATQDASGNLIDITSSLKRTDDNGNVITFQTSDREIIENSGYWAQINSSDLTIDNIRQSKALNTYNNKVYGNLYIVATLNNITNYNVAVYGYKNEGNDDITIQGIQIPSKNSAIVFNTEYQYNCPDGYGSDMKDKWQEGINNSKLVTEFPSDFCPGDVFDPNNVVGGSKISVKSKLIVDGSSLNKTYYAQFSTEEQSPQYIESADLYSVTNNYYFIVPYTTGIINYDLLPYMTYGELSGLQVTGSIDLSLVGSGINKVNVWKYYINDTSTDITWGMVSYPLYNYEIKEIIFDFIELSNTEAQEEQNMQFIDLSKSIHIKGRESYNGTMTISANLEIGKIYIVRITIFQDLITSDLDIQYFDSDGNIVSEGIVYNGHWGNALSNSTEQEGRQYDSVQWRAIVMDPKYYNDLYSKRQDFIYNNSTESLYDIREINILEDYSYTISKNPQYTTTSINFSSPSENGNYYVGSVNNQLEISINNKSEFSLDSDVFSIRQEDISAGYKFNTIETRATQEPTIVNNQFTVGSTISVEFPSYPDNGANTKSKINIQNDGVSFQIDIPVEIHATRMQQDKFCDWCYAPVSWNVWNMCGVSAGLLEQGVVPDNLPYVSPHQKDNSGHHDEFSIVMYKGLQELGNICFNEHSGDRSNMYDDLKGSLYQYTSKIGILPTIIFMSNNHANKHQQLHKGEATITFASQNYMMVLWKTVSGDYCVVATRIGRDIIRIWQTGTVLDSIIGDLNALLTKMYVYWNANTTVTGYFMSSSKYIEDFRGECSVELNSTSSNNGTVYYGNNIYDNRYIQNRIAYIERSFENLNSNLSQDQEAQSNIFNFLSIQLQNSNESHNISIPVSFFGSQILYYQYQQELNDFNTGVIAVMGTGARTTTTDGTKLTPGSILFGDYNTGELTQAPQWITETFMIQNNMPVLRGTETQVGRQLFVIDNQKYHFNHLPISNALYRNGAVPHSDDPITMLTV